MVKLCTKEKKMKLRQISMNQQRQKAIKKKQERRARFFTQTTQTLYQYGIASSTVLLGTMLVNAARRARSRLHMGQEEILGVFNHVYLVIKKKKKKRLVFEFDFVVGKMTASGGMKTHAKTVLVIHVFTRRNGNFCSIFILIWMLTLWRKKKNKKKQKTKKRRRLASS